MVSGVNDLRPLRSLDDSEIRKLSGIIDRKGFEN